MALIWPFNFSVHSKAPLLCTPLQLAAQHQHVGFALCIAIHYPHPDDLKLMQIAPCCFLQQFYDQTTPQQN